MKKLLYAIALTILFVFILSGCNKSGLSGKYVSDRYDDTYFQFSSGNKVTMRDTGLMFNGTYSINGEKVNIKVSVTVFGFTETVSFDFTISEDKKELTDGFVKYVKKWYEMLSIGIAVRSGFV